MDNGKARLHQLSKIAVVALGVQLLIALIFFKERFFFADTSYAAFYIINSKSLAIMNQRYGSFITQIVPYLAQRMHLPLTSVLISYAASFHLFYLTVIAVMHKCKQYGLAILMSFYYYLLVSDSFFLANDEIHQGIAWMFLFFAVIIQLRKKHINTLVILIPFIVLFFLTVSSHFIAIIPTLFLWVYLIIERDNWPFSNKKTIVLSVLILAIILLKFMISQGQSYENNYLSGVLRVSLKDIIESFSRPVVQMFLYRCLINYWIGVVVFFVGLISLLKSKKIKLAVWTLISCIGYFTLMGLVFGRYDGNFILCHIETEWASLSIILAAPFVFSFLPRLKSSMAILFLIVIFATRLVYICSSAQKFVLREHYKESIMAEMKKKGITKLALYLDSFHQHTFILDWTLSYETMLQSGMKGDDPQINFIFVNRDDKQTQDLIKNSNGFFDVWGMMPARALNKEYFRIDTANSYQIMTYEELFQMKKHHLAIY